MFENYILEQNKHWQNKKFDMGFSRDILEEIKKVINAKHIIGLIGVRRCGKSTVVKQIISYLINTKNINPKNILFFNLESPILYQYRNDPKYLEQLFNEYLSLAEPKGKIYVFLDEVQFFSGWQVFIKYIYEKGGVKFFITGSNSQILLSNLAKLLSGRTIIKNIYPFNFKEIAKMKGINTESKEEIYLNQRHLAKYVNDYLKQGGFPEILLESKKDTQKEILSNYYKNILYNDILPSFDIKKTKEFENLLLYLFSNIGQPYSYNSLSKFLKIHDKTVKEYIGYFQQSFLMFEISNYQYSLKKQENYPKKAYAIDNGFIDVVSFSFSENYSHFLENIVFIKLLSEEGSVFYHKDKYECDFVIKEKTKITKAIQVSKSIDLNNKKREFNGLIEAMEKFKLTQGTIITESQESSEEIKGCKIKIVPLWKWLLGV